MTFLELIIEEQARDPGTNRSEALRPAEDRPVCAGVLKAQARQARGVEGGALNGAVMRDGALSQALKEQIRSW